MPISSSHLVERLRREGEKTIEFFRSLTPEDLNKTLYSDGSQWKVRQLPAHFVTTESAFQKLIQNVVAGGEGAPEGFLIDEYNEKKIEPFKEVPLDVLLEEFTVRRAETIRIVTGMNEEVLSRRGRHPVLGIVPLEEIIKLLSLHIQIHQRDVKNILRGSGDEKAI